jgi:hypothetical protein
LKKGKKKIKMILGEENFVLFFTFAYLSVAKGGKEQNVL